MAGIDTMEALMNSEAINKMLEESDVNDVNQIRHRLKEARNAFFGDSVKGNPIDYNKRGSLNEIFTNYKLPDSASKDEYPYFDAAREQLLAIVTALGFISDIEEEKRAAEAAAAAAAESDSDSEEEEKEDDEAGGFSLFD